MACTVAVEEVIDEHYADQAARLDDSEAELKKTVEEFRADELAHKDTALAHNAEAAPVYPLLTRAIRDISRTAIWISNGCSGRLSGRPRRAGGPMPAASGQGLAALFPIRLQAPAPAAGPAHRGRAIRG